MARPWIDATDPKVRQSGRIVSVAVTIAAGVDADGRREVLGMAIGACEAEPFWTSVSQTCRSMMAMNFRGSALLPRGWE